MSGLEYPKLDTLYDRDEATFRVLNKVRRKEFETINLWEITEKINGRNTRVTLFDDEEIIYGGKTDDADIPTPLIKYLMDTFTLDKMKATFWRNYPEEEPPKSVTLYGEGYGAKMASGSGMYRNNGVSFRLFDVLVGGENGWWLERVNMEDVATKLGIRCVPLLGTLEIAPPGYIRTLMPSIPHAHTYFTLPTCPQDILNFFPNSGSSEVAVFENDIIPDPA